MYKDKDITVGAINYHLRRKGITRNTGRQVQIDHEYFNIINSEPKAYFLGLITADGSVIKYQKSKNGFSYILRLELKVEDKYLLEIFANELNSNLKPKEYEQYYQNRSKKHNAYISFHSKKIFYDLEKYGVVPNKTFKLNKLPNIPLQYMHHFIRGYFDGDGTVYFHNRYTPPQLRFGFYGTYDFLSSIRDYLVEYVGLNKVSVHKKKQSNVSMVTFAALNNIIKFYEYIYKDANIYLKRKKRKI